MNILDSPFGISRQLCLGETERTALWEERLNLHKTRSVTSSGLEAQA